MATVWDAARALLATTGTENAATAAARELELFCCQSREFDEAAFWLAVADAIAWECNPQPLIAPMLGGSAAAKGSLPRNAARGGMESPQHRSRVLTFRRDLREHWERYRAKTSAKRDEIDR